jgi:signal transduction histidine kinase
VNDILGKEEAGWTWERLRERLQGVVDIDDVYERCLANTEEMVKGDLKYGEKYLRIYLTPVKLVEGDGRVIGVVILVEDVTEEKQLQVARDEFFAVASHELRTPLSSIKGNASVIEDYFRDRVNDDQLMGIVKDIYDSSEKLIDIVNEYLDISRAEVGRLELTKKEFEVVEVLRQVMKELEYAAVSRGLAFELQVDEGFVAMVAADRDRTRQVLFNLLGNALKYTKTGGVYVKVVVDGWVRVKVYDTGQGVAMDEQGNLFGKFRQFGNKVYMQDVTEGTGMGLYISKLISEAMGGRVYLETSEVGKGSCFVLELERG